MIELNGVDVDAVGGGNVFLDFVAVVKIGYEAACAYYTGMSAIGGTLSNYYGTDMTLEIVAAGNMGA